MRGCRPGHRAILPSELHVTSAYPTACQEEATDAYWYGEWALKKGWVDTLKLINTVRGSKT